jgi:hypothetical protein
MDCRENYVICKRLSEKQTKFAGPWGFLAIACIKNQGWCSTTPLRIVTPRVGAEISVESACRFDRYSTVTLLARLSGWSTSVPFSTATW